MANELAKTSVAIAKQDDLPGFWPKVHADQKMVFDQGSWVNSNLSGNLYSSGNQLYDISPGTAVNYGRLAGPYWANSACQAVLNWIIRAWPESYPCVKKPGEGGKKLVVADHPLTRILMNPNDFDDDTTLWGGTVISFWCEGNAYWQIIRDRGGRVAQFDYIPHWAISPYRHPDSKSRGPDFYRMWTTVGPIEVDPADIVHFRFGVDPYNDMLGMSPWNSVSREVYTDNEGCNYTATTLRNRGTAWMIVSPSAADGEIDEPETVRDLIEARTTGDNRGRVVVLTGAVKVDSPGPMKDMDVTALRAVPVHRICALAGISVDSIDLGDAGDHVTFQNQKAADAKSWNTLVQVQRMMGRQLTKQVLWEPKNYNVPPLTLFAGFDHSEVRALEVQKGEEWDRLVKAAKAGVITRDEAREEMGYDAATPEQQKEIEDYLQSFLPEPPAPAEPKPMAVIPAAAATNGNGTGKAHGEDDLLKEIKANIGELYRS